MTFSLRSVLFTVLLALVLGGTSLPAHAQDDPDPQLPEIAPREIEIRGQFQIDFPSLQRQPLRGFAAPPTVPTLPPDRQPWTEPYKQDRSELPENLPDSPTVDTRLASTPAPASGYVQAGAGRYLSRFADGRLTLPVSRSESFEIDASYDGSAGFEPFDGSSVDTRHDDLDGTIGFVSRRSATTVRADAHGFVTAYSLYGAVPASPATAPNPDRRGRSGGLQAELQTRGSVETTAQLSFDQTRFETDVDPDAPARTQDEQRLAAAFELAVPFGTRDVRADASVTTSGLGSGAFTGDVATFDGGGSAVAYRSGPTLLRAGGRLLTFRALSNPAGSPDAEASATFVAPTLDAEVAFTPRFSLFLRNEPGLDAHSLTDVMAQNPWTQTPLSIRPTLTTTDAAAGVRVSAGPVRITAHAGYRYAPSFLFFAPATEGDYQTGVFGARYGSARVGEAGAGIALQGSDRVQAVLRATIRDGQLTGPDVAIPYFSPLVVESMVGTTFAGGKGSAQLTATVESPRYVDLTETEEAPALFDLDVEGSYQVTPLIHIVARVQNAAGTFERYARYERPGAVVSGGMRIHW